MTPSIRHRGSLSVEVVALVPMMVALLSFAVFGLRWTGATSDAVHAANIATRIASESRGATGITNGRAAAVMSLNASRWCRPATVHVSRIVLGDEIRYSATVACPVDLTGLSVLHMGEVHATGTSEQIVDRFRSDR